MRVIHLNCFDIEGGAARAAYRLNHCLRQAGVDSRMWVNQSTSGDWTVDVPAGGREWLGNIVRSKIASRFTRLLKTQNEVLHSPALFSTPWVRRINESSADLVHLHWVQGEMLSIKDISRIQKPLVWTLHDMWAFCGAEHYTTDFRWRDGYTQSNRPAYESGLDLNRWTWKRKQRYFQRPIQIIAPSNWMANCVQESVLMHNWPVAVVPNPIDTQIWKPIEKTTARQLFGLPPDGPVILFGAIKGGRYSRKGFDLLLRALTHLRNSKRVPAVQLVVFGQKEPKNAPDLGLPIHYTGHLHDDLTMLVLYSAADALVIPSRQDNLPNTGVEGQACGIPVIGFDTGGMSDIVEHQRTGYLSRAFDTEDLANGINWVLNHKNPLEMRNAARNNAVERFSNQEVYSQISKIYNRVLNS